MATMATTSHGLSVYVNSCVKNPLDPRTRQSVTFAERDSKHSRLAATDPGPVTTSHDFFDDEKGEFVNFSGNYNEQAAVRASFEDVETQLKNLTDEQFYYKLQQLKEANRKTLEECEKLYKEKYGGDDEGTGRSAKEMVESMFAARLAERSAERSKHVPEKAADVEREGVANGLTRPTPDYVKDMSRFAKPPPAPYSSKAGSGPIRSTTLPHRSEASRARPSSAPTYQPQRRAYSLDEEDWRRAMHDSSDERDENENQMGDEDLLDPDLITAISKVRDMWDNFKLEDYAGGRRHSSASLSGRPGKEKDKWRHRITIPKPFEMMMREEMKEKKKTKAQIELEEERRAKEREEEAECQKKFHAQPAPAHIYLPLYDEIMEKNEARRRFVQENSKELLLSKVKPFNFEKRELEKKGQLKHTVTVAERIARNKAKLQKAEQQFKAKPVPEFVRTTDVNEKRLAEEEFRKIRIRMRARELMQTASLPPNMAMQQKLKEQIEKEKILAAKKRARSGNAKRRTRSSREVPDYDFLYREFQKELTRRKQTREGTVMEPFALETGKLRSSREKVMRDMEKDAQTLRENRWPFQNPTPRSCLQRTGLASSLDSIPFKSTSTHDRRKEFLKSQMAREQHAAEMRKEEERRREMRQSQLRKYINDHSTEPSPRDYIKDRLKQHKAAEKSRQEQYEKDKEEMWSRVQKRPLLFEQETQTSAGKAAEKKFQTTLKNAGVDEEYVQTQSSRATRPYSDDDDNGAGDTTRLKTADQYEEDFE